MLSEDKSAVNPVELHSRSQVPISAVLVHLTGQGRDGIQVYENAVYQRRFQAGVSCTSRELRNDRFRLSVPDSELRRRRFANCGSTIDISLLVPTRLCSWPFHAREREITNLSVAGGKARPKNGHHARIL